MPLSWNEIRHNAIQFAREHKDSASEQGERQTFWNEFFEVFGKKRKHLAAFEEPVKKLSGHWGYIDLFWPGKCLVEHKSRGADLGKAHAQGMDYVRGLIDSGREKECPRWLIVSDFQRIAIHDLEPEQDPDLPLLTRLPASHEFALKDFPKNIRHFAFIAGYKSHKLNPEDPANFEATELMAILHDALYDGGFRGHKLCQFLVRLLFCFFADDTGIFPPDHLKLLLKETNEDGSDLGRKLAHIFQILDTPDGSEGTENERGKNLDEDLADFPYVNGDLFRERLDFTDFTRAMRDALIKCSNFKWEKISPAVFGSLFQTVFDHQDDRKRRQLGAHYTSERDILKVIRSLFLDADRAEFEAAKKDKSGRGPTRLRALQDKLASYKFLDPACGCGNFLVITYRELRKLELEILIELQQDYLGKQINLIDKDDLDIRRLSKINVDQMYGIEIEEFPARIAEVALWLTDHQANVLLSETFGKLFTRIPLRQSPHIHIGNALRKNWRDVLPPDLCSFILGNPPFIGKKARNDDQKEDMDTLWGDVKGSGVLDYVTCWFRKATEYMQGTKIISSFVATNSITQGEQPDLLWRKMFHTWSVQIHFAHRTFAWESEARGKAHVHVVIIGFGCHEPESKILFEYEAKGQEPTRLSVLNISPYLVAGSNMTLGNRSKPICSVSRIVFGNMPNDDGHLLLSNSEKNDLLRDHPGAAPLIKRLISSKEYFSGVKKWCLWLADAPPNLMRSIAPVVNRIAAVRTYRERSDRAATRKLANFPTLFGEIRQPVTNYILVPRHSSENRRYVPMSYFTPDMIVHDSCLCIPSASLYEFGVLHSGIHLSWMRTICGRIKSDFRYSNTLVYNNFPWPQDITEGQRGKVEQAAQAVLDARAKHTTSTLADLYDPLTMPPDLAKAHAALDAAVDRCYRPAAFPNDRARVEHLFALYEKITAPLAPASKKKPRPKP